MTEYEIEKMNENIEAVRYVTPEKPVIWDDSTKGATIFLCILTIFFLILAIAGSMLSLIIFIGFLALDIFLIYGTVVGYKEDMKKYNKNMDNIEEYRNTIMNNVKEMHEKQSYKLQAEVKIGHLFSNTLKQKISQNAQLVAQLIFLIYQLLNVPLELLLLG